MNHEKRRDEHRGICIDDQSGSVEGVRPVFNGQDDHHCFDGRERDHSKSAREGRTQCLSEKVAPPAAIRPYLFHRRDGFLFRPALDRSESRSRLINSYCDPQKILAAVDSPSPGRRTGHRGWDFW